ncbi:DUF4907 domain-containing protein [Spirosoma gilvum]
MPDVTPHTQPKRSRARLTQQGLLLILVSLACLTVYQFYGQHEPEFRVEVIKTSDGWGYNILKTNKLVIHQPTIPGQPGTVGFTSQEQARRVGEWVVEKIKQTKALPTLTNEELRQLGVKIP